jgi:hypothetical protein
MRLYNIELTWSMVITILVVLVLGLIAINQYIKFNYQIQLLADPCGSCVAKNPGVSCYRPNVQNYLGVAKFEVNNSNLPE